jgi:histidinol-phosphatase (PHP family)
VLLDYHVHTALCGHATGSLEEYLRVARQKSLIELGFNDHAPTFHVQDPELAMDADQLPMYVESVKALQRRHSRPRIKLGIEADFIPGYEDRLRQLLEQYPFDFVYGSVHLIGDWRFDDSRVYPDQYGGRDANQAYQRYFDLIITSAMSGLFDILGHIDLIKKFNYRPTEDIDRLLRRTVESIAKAGVCVEVNTSGLRRPCAEIYPSENILRLCHQHGVPVTLGSDAHSPQEVGMDFEKARDLLRRVGYTQVATFTRRQRAMVEL